MFVRDVELVPDVSIVGISGASPICRWQDSRFGLWSWRAVSVVILFFAIDGYLPSASMTALWCRGRGEQRGSILLFIILGLPWVAAQRQASPADL